MVNPNYGWLMAPNGWLMVDLSLEAIQDDGRLISPEPFQIAPSHLILLVGD
jgi:hypothetical protein